MPAAPQVPVEDPPAPRPPDARWRRWLWTAAVVLVLGLVALGIGPRLYAASRADDAAAPLAPLAAAPAAEGAAPGGVLDGSWSVVPGGAAGYRVDEVLNGQPVTVTGRTERVSGSFDVASGALVAGGVAVDLASVTTDSGARDDQFARIVGVEANPEATFVLGAAVPLGGLEEPGAAVAVTLPGVLTLNGAPRDVRVAATAELTDADTLTVTGSVPVTWADHGVEAPDLGFVSVEDAGVLEFQVVADRA